MELLKAKDAIFRLIGQFHHATKFDDGELYICNYCESALERAFTVLEIEEDYIKLMDFCQMWEDNNRAIWAINIPNEPFGGITANDYYDIFKKDYEIYEKQFEKNDFADLIIDLVVSDKKINKLQ